MRTRRDGNTRWLLVIAAATLAVATVLLVAVPLSTGTPRRGAAAAPVTSPAAVTTTPPRTSVAENPAATRHSANAASTVEQLDAARCADGPAGKRIRVSISAQRAWLCDGGSLALATPVTTGADVPDRETHVGTWQIQGKQTDRWLGGPGYSVQVDWWMPYDGDFGLHDASWQTMPFGSDQWRTDGSHGCVHVPHAAMATLFAWAPVGTPITVEA